MALPEGLPPPNVHPDEEPFVCIRLNPHWIPYIIGALWPAKFPEYWAGTLAENRQARWDVNNLIALLEDAKDCDEMSSGCCHGEDLTVVVMTRVTADFTVQISIDGGTTWTTSPNNPASNVIALPPPVTAGIVANKCDAATNGLEHFKDVIAGIDNVVALGGTAAEAVVAIAEIIVSIIIGIITEGAGIGLITTVAAMIFTAVRAVVQAGETAFNAYWTEEVYDKILCAIYCNILPDGTFDDTAFGAFYGQLNDTLPAGIPKNMLFTVINSTGKAGLNRMCADGAAAGGDCSACSCDCDLTAWTIQIGTLVSRDASHITVQSVLTDGSWVAEVKSNLVSAACQLALPTYEGPDTATIQYNKKGEVYLGDFPAALGHGGIWGSSQCVNAVLVFGDGGGEIGQVTFTTTGDCT